MKVIKKVLVQEFLEWCRLNELPGKCDRLDKNGCFEDGIYQLFLDSHPKYSGEESGLADYLKKAARKDLKQIVVQKFHALGLIIPEEFWK